MNIYGPPTIGPAVFGAVLGAAKSPVLAERKAGDYYALIVSYGIDPAFILSIAKFEHSYGTNPQAVITRYGLKNWGDTRTRRKATLGGKSVGTDRGNFWGYLSWYDSLDDLCYRLSDPTYAYAGKRTVEQIVPVMAPDGDQDNNAALYVRNVLAQMAAWQAQDNEVAKGTSMLLAKPPMTDAPSPNHGYPGDYKPEIITWHITAGSGASALSWLRNPDSNASANYLTMETGEIKQLVNPENGQQGAAWANGDVQNPNMANPSIAAYYRAGINQNRRCVSIENAGQSSYGKGGSLTGAQIAALVNLTAWLCKRFGIPPDREHIVPHAWINDVTRHNCPGFSEAEWTKWIGLIAALVNGTSKVPIVEAKEEEGIVAGYVDKPGQGVYWGTDENGEPFLVIKPGGQMRPGTVNVALADIGVSGIGMDNAQYSISIKDGKWGGYNRTTPGKP